MKILFVLIFTAFFGIGYSQTDKFFPAFEGWQSPAEIKHYDASTLYEIIDGAAENYLSYGFMDLYMGDYTRGDDYISVEVYSMKSQLLSYGIYASERNPNAFFVSLGAEGYTQKGLVIFQYGPYYIKISSNLQTDDITMQEVALAKRMTTSFFACTALPFELTAFPAENKKEKSEMVIPKNFLGLSFLSMAVTCDYQVNGLSYKLFIMNFDKAEKAKETVMAYLNYAGQKTDVVEGVYTIKDKYNGTVELGWKGSILFGVVGVEDNVLRKSIMEKYSNTLKAGYFF